MLVLRTTLRSGLCALALLVALDRLPAAKPEEWLVWPSFGEPVYSPDGKWIAVLKGPAQRDSFPIFFDTETLEHRFMDLEMRDFPDFKADAKDLAWVTSSLVAVTSDAVRGETPIHRLDLEKRTERLFRSGARYGLVDGMPGGSKFVVTERPKDDAFGDCRVLELDLEDKGYEKVLYVCQSDSIEAVTDRDHRLRMVKRKVEEGGWDAWFALQEDGSWKRLKLPGNARVYGFSYQQDRILVGGRFGESKPGIHFYDIARDEVAELLASDDHYDISQAGRPVFSEAYQSVVGLHMDGVLPHDEYFVPLIEQMQAKIDETFKDSRNRLVAWPKDFRTILARRIAGNMPDRCYLIDFNGGRVSLLYTDGVTIDEKEANRYEPIQFRNRDGVMLRGYLTLPPQKAKKSPPLVVHVRDDPFATRSEFGWNHQTQYLASEGFAVLELNFRGSAALLGEASLDIASEEDALKPFRDLEDGIAALAAKEIIDPERVAIFGQAGGGYVAAYAPIASPGTYQAAVSMGGIYDLTLYRKKGNPALSYIGRVPFAEESKGLSLEALERLSPVHQASRLDAELYIAYGKWSPVSYIGHAREMRTAARKAAGVKSRVVPYEWWGAHPDDFEEYVRYMKDVAKFLRKEL